MNTYPKFTIPETSIELLVKACDLYAAAILDIEDSELTNWKVVTINPRHIDDLIPIGIKYIHFGGGRVLARPSKRSCDAACSPSDWYEQGKCGRNGCFHF